MLINLYQNENGFIHLNLVKKNLFTLAPITCNSTKKNFSYGIQMNKCAFPPIVDFKQKKKWQQFFFESVKRDLKDWNITKELAMDRGAWKLAIHVPEP